MKKLIAVLCALLLICPAVFAFAEEETGSMPVSAETFEGEWQCDRATASVYWEEEGFKVLITWGSSAWEHTEWQYSCYYHEEDNKLVAVPFGIRTEYVYGDDGELVSATDIYDDGEAVFSLDEKGYLIWQDQKDNAGEGMRFEKLPDEPAAEETILSSEGTLSEQAEGLHVNIQHVTDSPAWVANLPAAQEAGQLFVVAAMGMDKTTAYITMHQKDADGNWKQILSTPGFVGKNGLCADADHKEGCAQTPIGVYHFNKAFGIAPDPGCALPYIRVDENTYWSGDPDRQYNEMVDIREVPDLVMDDSEHIVDYEYQYQYCLNISFNEEGTPGRGSAIFLHCFGPAKPYTGGCVAVPENIMRMIMRQVSPECAVIIDTFENLGGSF
ncbi:MAG: hypothetical protein K6F61_10650 [Clostridiales bacterium]|nr:hypothetical protein [Clostridiales bacterium]